MGVGRNLRVGVGAASFIGTILACIWRLFEANRLQLQCQVQQNNCPFNALMVLHPAVIIPLVLFLGLTIWPPIQSKIWPILFPRVDRKAGKGVWDPFGTRTGQASIDLDQELSKAYDPNRSSPGLYLQMQPTMTLSQAKGQYEQTAQQGWNPDHGYGSQPQDAYTQYATWEGGYQQTGGHGYQQQNQAHVAQAGSQQQAYQQQEQQQQAQQQAQQQQAYQQQAHQQQAHQQQAHQQQAHQQQAHQQLAHQQQAHQQLAHQQQAHQQQAHQQQAHQQQAHQQQAHQQQAQQQQTHQQQAYQQQTQAQQSQAHATLASSQQQAYGQQAQQQQAQSHIQSQTSQSTQSDWDGWWQGEDGQWYWWDATTQTWIPWQG